MSRPYPEQPRPVYGHPLAGQSPWRPSADARDALRLWCDFRPAINSVCANWASSDAGGLTWGTLSAARPTVGTIDGRAGLSLAGAAYVSFPVECGIPAATDRATVWCRFVLNAGPGNGALAGVFNQWNNGGGSQAFQAFELSLLNNVGGRPARTLEVVFTMDDGSLRGAEVQYAAADVGDVWTAVGVADGSAVRVYLLKSSGMYAGTTSSVMSSSYTSSRTLQGSSVGGLFVGQIDGSYADMTALGVGVWPGRALTEQQIRELHADPWGFIAPKRWKRRLGRPGAASQQVNYSNDTTADYWMVLNNPWEFETETGNTGTEFVDEDAEYETVTELLAYAGGSLTAEPEASFPLEFETVTVAGQQAFFSGPQSVSYANFTAVATTASVVDVAEYETVTGARVRVQLRPDGRTDLLDDRRYRR